MHWRRATELDLFLIWALVPLAVVAGVLLAIVVFLVVAAKDDRRR